MAVGQPGTLCQSGGWKLTPIRLRRLSFQLASSNSNGVPNPCASKTKENSLMSSLGSEGGGGRNQKNTTPKALSRRRTAQPRRSGTRAPWTAAPREPKRPGVTKARVCGGDGSLLTVKPPTPGSNTAKGVAGGLHDVPRNEALRKAGTPSDRPPSYQRASAWRGMCGVYFSFLAEGDTLTPRLAQPVTGLSFAGRPGWRFIGRQRCAFERARGWGFYRLRALRRAMATIATTRRPRTT